MGQAQINVRIRACSRTSIARTKQAALTHNVRGKELTNDLNSNFHPLIPKSKSSHIKVKSTAAITLDTQPRSHARHGVNNI